MASVAKKVILSSRMLSSISQVKFPQRYVILPLSFDSITNLQPYKQDWFSSVTPPHHLWFLKSFFVQILIPRTGNLRLAKFMTGGRLFCPSIIYITDQSTLFSEFTSGIWWPVFSGLWAFLDFLPRLQAYLKPVPSGWPTTKYFSWIHWLQNSDCWRRSFIPTGWISHRL